MNGFDILHTIEVEELLMTPHLSYYGDSIRDKKRVAFDVASRNTEDILLISSSGFLIDSVLAGISEKHIEYIAQYGPQNYKENIRQGFSNKKVFKSVLEIAKAMDDDEGNRHDIHQQRIRNVIQYLKDNNVAFQF